MVRKYSMENLDKSLKLYLKFIQIKKIMNLPTYTCEFIPIIF